MRRLYTFAINNYPDPRHSLSGCLNDQTLLIETFKKHNLDFKYELFKDSSATTDAMIGSLVEAKRRWELDKECPIIQYSGHGTNRLDLDGDEGDGYDEGWYMYDGVLWDDILWKFLKDFPIEARLVIMSDSCYSGNGIKGAQKSKFIPLGDFEIPKRKKIKKRGIVKDNDFTCAWLSGCAENQTSADATFNKIPNGAFTYYAANTFDPKDTIKEWHNKYRKHLPSWRFTQNPQLEGNSKIYNLPLWI